MPRLSHAASSKSSAQMPVKALLRIIDFASHRQCVLQTKDGSGHLVDREAPNCSCRVTADILQAGLSAGLFRIEQAGLFALCDAALLFAKRHRQEGTSNPYALQHSSRQPVSLEIDGVRRRVLRNSNASSLCQLERIKGAGGIRFFSQDLLAAGERLAADFAKAQLQPRITSRWQPRLEETTRSGRNAAADISDFAATARQRFNRALSAIGPELSGVVVDAICFEKGLELIERERQWPARSAKLMLRTGLEILARHYQPAPVAKAPMRNWHEEA